MPEAGLPLLIEEMSAVSQQLNAASVFLVANDGGKVTYYHF